MGFIFGEYKYVFIFSVEGVLMVFCFLSLGFFYGRKIWVWKRWFEGMICSFGKEVSRVYVRFEFCRVNVGNLWGWIWIYVK